MNVAVNAAESPLLTWVQICEGGEDPRYSDDFSAIRAEVEKLGGNDFERISELGQRILTDQSLDLRVLAYLSLAHTYLHGVTGLHDALRAWHLVLTERWDTCFPERDKARRGAVEWLTNERLPVYLARHVADTAAIPAVLDSLDAFHQAVSDRLGDDAPRLKAVRKWLEGRLEDQKVSAPAAAPAPAIETDQDRPVRSAPSSETSAPSGAIDSDKAEQKALRDLLAWYRSERRYGQLVALGRVMRWSDLTPPPADNGTTRLPPPRPASLNAISAALDRQQWDEALLAAERAFLEPGGQFCFQIQHWAHQAASAAGQSSVAALIERETCALLGRHRDLVRLRFSDGEPFVAGSAANWIESVMAPAAGGGNGAQDGKWEQAAEHATALSQAQGLVAGLAALDEMPTRGRKQRSEQDLLKAELCLNHQRAELALPLLEAVSERLDEHGMPAWDPAFSLRVWRLTQQALRAQEDSEKVREKLMQVTQRISRTDVTAAAAML